MIEENVILEGIQNWLLTITSRGNYEETKIIINDIREHRVMIYTIPTVVSIPGQTLSLLHGDSTTAGPWARAPAAPGAPREPLAFDLHFIVNF